MVPLANMFGYVNQLRSMSQGRAQYTMQFDHYEQVPNQVADEIQKKFALAAACVVLALAAAAIAIRFPRGGGVLMIVAGAVVFTAYYVSLGAGESLADRGIVSPVVAMWLPNLLLLAAVLLLLWWPGPRTHADAAARLALGG